MVFPQTPLPVSIQIAPGANLEDDPRSWWWRDITDKTRVGDGIEISAGRRDEASVVDPASCQLTLDNTGGHFCRTNPLGKWYGTLGKNTPLRVRVPYRSPNIVDRFNRTAVNTWSATDTGDFWQLTGFGGTVSVNDFDIAPATGGTMVIPVAGGYRIAYNEFVQNHDLEAAVTTWCPMPTGGDLEPANVCLRMDDFDVTDCYLFRVAISPAGVVTAKIIQDVTSVELASVVVPGITYSANLKLRVRAKAYVDKLYMRVWLAANPEPATWTLQATNDQIAWSGAVGIRSGRAAGNTNVNPVFSYDDWEVTEYRDRFSGNVPEWPPRWDKSGKDVTVPIKAAGILRRLQQGESPIESPIRRAMNSLDPADRPKIYYPLEEGEDADVPRPDIPVDGQPAQIIGEKAFGQGEGLEGSPPIYYQARASGLKLPALTGWSPGDWSIDWQMRTEAVPPNSPITGLAFFSDWSGTYEKIELPLDMNSWRVHGQDADAFTDWFIINSGSNIYDGEIHHYRLIFLATSPTQYDVFSYRDGVQLGSVGVAGSLGTCLNFEAPCRVQDPTFSGYADLRGNVHMGHVAVWNGYPQWQQSYVDLPAAAIGYKGELAADRFSRLCIEENIGWSVYAGDTVAMGPQKAAKVIDLLREVEEADGGILFENGFGLTYLPRETRYNRGASLTLDFVAGHIAEPPEPVDDDQGVTNDVLVKRWRGRQARYTDHESGQSVDKIGRYDTEVELNLDSDEGLLQHASWRVHKGTNDGLRWPVLAMDLAARPALVDQWLSMPLFGRIVVNNPPAEVGPTQVDVILEGYRERLEPYGWKVWANCSPAATWDVFDVSAETGDLSPSAERLDTDGSTLTAGITATATSFQVTTTAPSPVWTTVADDLPIDLNISGERIRVTAIAGAVSPQTFTVTRAINGVSKAQVAGAKVSLWNPRVVAL